MALFSKETKEEKQELKLQSFIEKYGLEDVSDGVNREIIQSIARSMSANKFTELGTALQGNATETAKLTYLKAIVEQNFIIIRQLDKLTK